MRCLSLSAGLLAVLLLSQGSTLGASQELSEAAQALDATLDVERELLDEDLRRYDSMSRQRTDVAARLSRLYLDLDSAVRQREAGDPERLDQLLDLVQRTEGDRAAVLATERVLLETIRDRLRRVSLLETRVSGLEGEEPEEQGILTGTWDLVLLPQELRGSFTLEQTGALITGTYRLEGNQTGSFQGTLVDRKVHMVRIDSKLGKNMELEGWLSSDRRQIRGSWLNYELAGQDGSTGSWSATRRSEDP